MNGRWPGQDGFALQPGAPSRSGGVGEEMGENQGDLDEDLETWDHFVAAVRHLAAGPRPALSFAEAQREALQAWLGEQAALYHRDEPFQP